MAISSGRRGFILGLGAAGLSILAAACGGQAANTPAPTSAPAAAAKPTEAPKPAAAGAPAGQVVIPPTPTERPGVADLPAPKQGQKVITYWHNFGAGVSADAHQKQIKMFLDANPTYAVDAQYTPTTAGTQLSE